MSVVYMQNALLQQQMVLNRLSADVSELMKGKSDRGISFSSSSNAVKPVVGGVSEKDFTEHKEDVQVLKSVVNEVVSGNGNILNDVFSLQVSLEQAKVDNANVLNEAIAKLTLEFKKEIVSIKSQYEALLDEKTLSLRKDMDDIATANCNMLKSEMDSRCASMSSMSCCVSTVRSEEPVCAAPGSPSASSVASDSVSFKYGNTGLSSKKKSKVVNLE